MHTKKEDKDDHQKYIPGVQEKTTLGGPYNSGVTSSDPEEKNEIEKKGSLAILKPRSTDRNLDENKPPANDQE